MGNTTSTSSNNPDRDLDLIKGLATIDESSYPNFFEAKSIVPQPTTGPKKRKYSSTSTMSSTSCTLPPPPVIIEEEKLDDNLEIICNRKYLKPDNSSHRFYLPVDDQESDRLVILVTKKHTTLNKQTNMFIAFLGKIRFSR
jgi:hypothetical protein